MYLRPKTNTWRTSRWLGASVLGHAAIALVAVSMGVGSSGGGGLSGHGQIGTHGDGAPDIDPACLVEGLLATGARAAMCLVPDGTDHDACLAGALTSFELSKLACTNMAVPIDITMLDAFPPGGPPESDTTPDMNDKLDDDPEKTDKQVVEIPAPELEMRPDDADLSSEYESKVDKQSVRPGKPIPESGGIVGGARVERDNLPTGDTGKPSDGEKGRGAKGALAMRDRGQQSPSPAQKPSIAGQQDGRELSPDGTLPTPGEATSSAGANAGSPGGGAGTPDGDGKQQPTMKDLRPSQEAIGSALGNNDYLPDIDEGNETLLNTKRFKYATFFNRVKRAVEVQWHPNEVYQLRDPTGKIYGTKDRLTVLKVSLRPDGSLDHVLVEQPCGVDFLDDEAVSAFKAAQPFPHPPAGLVDKQSNLITFRFGFSFVISEGADWKIFRYAN